MSLEDEPLHVLFVCSGNITRSPMAEGIASHLAGLAAKDVEFRSAGTLQLVGRPVDPRAAAVCEEIGVSVWDHRSQGLTQELLDWADQVWMMEFAHGAYIREHLARHEQKVQLLGTLGGTSEISDPTGFWKFRYRRTRDLILRCAEALVQRIPRGEDL